MKAMRQSTLETLGLGSPLNIFKSGRMPVESGELIDKVFGLASDRGALVISGGNGIVGSGKAMQLGARLLQYGVPIVTLDLPDAPAGLKGQYAGLSASFGPGRAAEIMSGVIQLSYDGKRLPESLKRFKPRFVLEAIPEILSVKRAHYAMLRETYPGIEIRSVTSGFPSRELGVGILHPSFPHQINKVWEVIEDEPSDIARLLWALGLQPVPVGDHWSFILDVLFCGVTLAALRYHNATNMPYWKVDKLVRRLVGPNPLRAHDAIGPGASFLTWSCLHHLSGEYGALFEPEAELVRRKDSGESWYPTTRPVIDFDVIDDAAFNASMLGPLLQMTGLLLAEKRGHLSHINAIGELCAQFARGMLAQAREMGEEQITSLVSAYHRMHPAAMGSWKPEGFANMGTADWTQLYVNAEHDGTVGVITISRETLNRDVILELNRAIDWLKKEGIDRVILCSDFHLSTQMVGADTSEFYPALSDESVGYKVAKVWSRTARRLQNEFAVSVGFVGGKRCLGGMLELMMHCKYLVALSDSQLGMPEVTLPVVPGMEGCHLAFRRAKSADWSKIAQMLMTGKALRAPETVGWLTDFVGSNDEALKAVWDFASGAIDAPARPLEKAGFDLNLDIIVPTGSGGIESGRQAIAACAREACRADYSTAIEVQAKHSAAFMVSKACRKGVIGSSMKKVMEV